MPAPVLTVTRRCPKCPEWWADRVAVTQPVFTPPPGVEGMPTCPECGHSESTVDDWFEYSSDNSYSDGTALVCCPSCDAVLGGGVYAAGA
jgi:hypothetical protein